MPKKTRYPCQKEISVAQPSGPVAANVTIDVPASLSQVNHRLYRQSRYYECSVSIDANVADGTTVDVYALMDTWYTQKALQMAKKAWDESNAEEKMMLKGKIARWNDFRVEAGLSGFGGTDAIQFSRSNLTATPFLLGEFDNSMVVDQAGAQRTFTWGPPTATQYNILAEYEQSGNTSSDPEDPSGGPYNGLLPGLEAGAADALTARGNEPPYSANNYGGGYWVKVGTLHLSAGRQRLSTGFFTAPCGMIALTNVGFLTNPDIQVSVKKGDYKGVHAPSMLE